MGQPRGECLVKHLVELNPEVKGQWYTELGALDTYDVIILTNPVHSNLRRNVTEYCKTMHRPLINICSQGFFACMQIQLGGSFPIVETKGDDPKYDLRLFTPWPQLEALQHELTGAMDSLSDHKHGHIPWLILLLHYLDEWKATHDGKLPGNYREKKEFQKMVQAGQRINSPEGFEENYDEAVKAVISRVQKIEVPNDVKQALEMATGSQKDNTLNPFWEITRAVKKFHEKFDRLPLSGTVPDMKAESDVYVRLQNIYKAEAAKEVDRVLELVPTPIQLDREEVELYCKNAAFIKVVRSSIIERDAQGPEITSIMDRAHTLGLAKKALREEDPYETKPDLAFIYLIFRAVEDCRVWDMNEQHVMEALCGMLQSREIDETIRKNEGIKRLAKEITRAKGAELHNISALVGGVVGQEVIKLVTKQYVPVDGVWVWDGLYDRSATFRF